MEMNDENFELENEKDYFKLEALRLFEENKALKQQIHHLRASISDMQQEVTTQNNALIKAHKKIFKVKS